MYTTTNTNYEPQVRDCASAQLSMDLGSHDPFFVVNEFATLEHRFQGNTILHLCFLTCFKDISEDTGKQPYRKDA